jgi:YidC/Oxa1 family membrane protein insertase
MTGDNKNFILAIVLSMVIIFGWQIFYAQPEIERQRAEQARQAEIAEQAGTEGTVPGGEGVAGEGGTVPQVTGESGPAPVVPGATLTRDAAIAASGRVNIKTPSIYGSINLSGGRLDDLHLSSYRQTVAKDSDKIILLSPSGTKGAFFADQGWAPAVGGNVKLPGAKTVWSAPQDAVLTPDSPVTLTWDNGEGLIFERTFSVDEHYLFTVRQSVRNSSSEPVTLYPYSRVQRQGTPITEGIYVLHEGLIGVLDEELQEVDYSDVKGEAPVKMESTGGWVGITDKYWAVALVPDQQMTFTGSFFHRDAGGRDLYQSDFLSKQGVTIAPGGDGSYESKVFAGAKVFDLINKYEGEAGIHRFDLLIDWGWFYFITKPMFWLLNTIQKMIGNFGLAILIVTVLVKLAFFPLANKSYVSMARMKVLQPEMKKLQERFGDDKPRLQKEMMELYKKEKVNPMSGCLPILVQIPVFFALYKVLYVTIEMRHAPFYGWIKDLSAQDPTSMFNLFGLIPWDPPSFLLIGVLPLLMGITMWIQMRLNPAPPDPVQAQIFTWMPVFFTFLLASFPAGLVLYWAWNNFLSILQQYTIMKRQGADVNLIQNIKDSLPFLFKKKPAE